MARGLQTAAAAAAVTLPYSRWSAAAAKSPTGSGTLLAPHVQVTLQKHYLKRTWRCFKC
ncbi:hypothetical protein BRADI_4g01865v3 [Brachypodium distachyon]|uniref:Uncharacterized protein n=1 Tax=Brachypodium distachyon TaxID=15368 RepID=A0A0Q3GYA7_BRADI|nr:hypothetical protein BRADI_4g01865v3 [Brachypodium distachyon]